jgi:TolB protein
MTFCMLMGSHLYGAEDPLVVVVGQGSRLTPLYIAAPQTLGSSLPAGYAERLAAVLTFDLKVSGELQLLQHTPERARSALLSLNDPKAVVQWQQLRVPYVVAISLVDKQLAVQLLSTKERRIKTFEAIDLTGNLNGDRRQVHLVADAIHRALFGRQGIASTKILYASKCRPSEGHIWKSEIYECDYDGANCRKVSTPAAGYAISPVYVPPLPGHRSSSYFYVAYAGGQPKIWYGSLHGDSSGRLTPLRGNQLMPAVSQQRDKLLFISDAAGNPDLFLQEFSPHEGPIGKPRQIFTAHKATQGSPTFHPNGSKVAFVSNKDGSTRVYVIDLPTVHTPLSKIRTRLISKANRESSAPSWSPDGSKLAYCARQTGARQIWIYDFATNEEWQLTQGNADKENPSWASNSTHLVYNTTGREGCELYIVDLKSREPVKISSGAGDKRFPCWEPILLTEGHSP